MLEGYTALGFVAGRTERLRLRLLVTGVTYRHPGLLAKTVTTLDVLSGGRAELGIGAAWYEREHRGLGVPFPPAGRALRAPRGGASRSACRCGATTTARTTGRHYQLAETLCSPAPVSSPRPRILIGGGGERKTLRLVAQYADACNIFGGPTRSPTRSTCCAATATRSDATRTRSRSPPCTATSPPDATRRRRRARRRGARRSRRVDARHRRHRRRPGGWLESTFGPAMDRLGELEPVRP